MNNKAQSGPRRNSTEGEKTFPVLNVWRGRAKVVLLVEDSEDDVFFMRRAWQQADVPHSLQVVTDGNQALDYLSGNGKYADRAQFPLPCLMLLDWKLPYLMGEEVLRTVRRQPGLSALPVLVLSSSVHPKDIDRAYKLGANGYLEKPPTDSRLADLVKLIRKFWLDTIRFPSNQI